MSQSDNMAELQVYLDRATIFYDYLRVDGWLVRDKDDLCEIIVKFGDKAVHSERQNLHLPSPDIGLHGHCRFSVSALLSDSIDRVEPTLIFRFDDGVEFTLQAENYTTERLFAVEKGLNAFRELVADRPDARVLEIGSRARSGTDRRHEFAGAAYTGVDIVEGPNVDIVADAHELSEAFAEDYFDFAFSISVFEHLAMPWKAVIELNRVVKPGGVVYVQSHQTCGMHDLPWDFWRFSESAYRALFNRHTGFEVIDTRSEVHMHTIPFLRFWAPWQDAEQFAGYYMTYVLARKVGATSLEWNVPLIDVTEGLYPG